MAAPSFRSAGTLAGATDATPITPGAPAGAADASGWTADLLGRPEAG